MLQKSSIRRKTEYTREQRKLTVARSRCRHPRSRLRWWSHLASLRHPPSHCQIHHRLLPKVRRRALQEPAQAGPHPVRPHTPRCRQQAVRAQEVRWSRCPRQVPEVLPLSGFWLTGGGERERWVYGGAWSGVHPGLFHGVFYCLLSTPQGRGYVTWRAMAA